MKNTEDTEDVGSKLRQQKERIEYKERDKTLWVKIGFGIFLFLVLVGIIWYKFINPEFSLLFPLLFFGIGVVLFVVSLFFKQISKRFIPEKSAEEIPEAIDYDEILRILYETVEGTPEKDYKDGYFRNIRAKGQIIPRMINQNEIYAIHVELSAPIVLRDEKGKSKEASLWIIINANYPKKHPGVFKGSERLRNIERYMNDISSNPNPEPDTREIEVKFDQFNRPTEFTRERRYKAKQKDNKREESVV